MELYLCNPSSLPMECIYIRFEVLTEQTMKSALFASFWLLIWLATLKMEAVCSYKTAINLYQTTVSYVFQKVAPFKCSIYDNLSY
jgi:hypothetical protein